MRRGDAAQSPRTAPDTPAAIEAGTKVASANER